MPAGNPTQVLCDKARGCQLRALLIDCFIDCRKEVKLAIKQFDPGLLGIAPSGFAALAVPKSSRDRVDVQ
jgi:hypothetical protein